MLSAELLKELKIILKEDYGVDLEQDELPDVATKLLSFFELLAKVETESTDQNNT